MTNVYILAITTLLQISAGALSDLHRTANCRIFPWCIIIPCIIGALFLSMLADRELS